jgi:AraC-like DNA-binding protein/mannose-6-phosphate isomerase-like protein (cupin superfamily)
VPIVEKLNSIHNSIDQTNLLKQIIPDLPHQHHFKIHAAYHNGKVIPSWGFSNRVNEDYHIVLVVSGKGTYTLEGKEESLHQGKIIFVSDKFCHSAQQNQNTGLEIIPLRFGLYSNTNRKPLREFTRPFCISSTPVDFQKYIHLFENIHKYFSFGEIRIYRGMCNALLYQILTEFYQDLIAQGRLLIDKRLEMIRIYIEEHPLDRLNMVELSKRANLSKRYLSQVFKQQYGKTPKAFMIQIRINQARFLLQESTKNIQEIANILGYADQYAFSKQFKKMTGISPKFERIQESGKNNVLDDYQSKLKTEITDKDLIVFVHINVTESLVSHVCEELNQIMEVIEVYIVKSGDRIFVKILSKNINHFNDIFTSKILSIPHVESSSTFIVSEIFKEGSSIS